MVYHKFDVKIKQANICKVYNNVHLINSSYYYLIYVCEQVYQEITAIFINTIN